jgi:hypothetical protein
MRKEIKISIGAIFLALILLYSSFYILNELMDHDINEALGIESNIRFTLLAVLGDD